MNELQFEKSPYLKQHEQNPVHWKAWKKESFDLARSQKKAIFLSIGYSTCHWCHVMEKESFENQQIADFLNEHFISIKVDREELPQVDALYMDALQMMSQRGGWPLNIFLDNDLSPFYGGTYFPAKAFLQVLGQLQNLWINKKEDINKVSTQIKTYLNIQDKLSERPDLRLLKNNFLIQCEKMIDPELGGHKGAPKFPMNTEAQVLLRLFDQDRDTSIKNDFDSQKALALVELSLEKMLLGGIWDHIGGGLHRYSTDDEWRAPHFEKMLYDQASLLGALCEVIKRQDENKKVFFLQRAIGILDYLERDLKIPQGAFYSAEDADSEGHEGTFYVWTLQELRKILSDNELLKIKNIFEISESGNWEGKIIFHTSSIYSFDEVKEIFQKLLTVRSLRPRPLRDEKVICAWNGLMISSLSRFARITADHRALKMAQEAADFLIENLYINKQLYRRWIEGECKFLAQLDDYSFFIEGLLELYSASSQLKYLELAKELQDQVESLFWDEEAKTYNSTRKDEEFIFRKNRDSTDNVVPSALSATLHNLIWLGELGIDVEKLNKAETLAETIPNRLLEIPAAYPRYIEFLDLACNERETVAILTDGATSLLEITHNVETVIKPRRRIVASCNNLQPIFLEKTLLYKPVTFYVCFGKKCSAASSNYQ